MNFLLHSVKSLRRPPGAAEFLTLPQCRTQNFLDQSVRRISHGDMYMPKSWYRCRGTSKPNHHKLEKFREMRAAKVIKMDLPELDSYHTRKLQEENPEEFVREQMKLHGLDPCRPVDRQTKFFVGCSNSIIDPYVPPENDGSFSEMSGGSQGLVGALKAKATALTDKGVSAATRRWQVALKHMKAADSLFTVETFGERALNIYMDAHNALQNRHEAKLHDLVTEFAFPRLWDELQSKTLRWQYVKSLEPPTVVHLRKGGDSAIFGQVTVRLHSQQKLAIYDQFGRLFMGNEHVARDVLEYVVFENFINNEYGIWRLHAKIASKKSSPAPCVHWTYVKKTADVQENLQEKFKYSYNIDEKSMEHESKPEVAQKGG